MKPFIKHYKRINKVMESIAQRTVDFHCHHCSIFQV